MKHCSTTTNKQFNKHGYNTRKLIAQYKQKLVDANITNNISNRKLVKKVNMAQKQHGYNGMNNNNYE